MKRIRFALSLVVLLMVLGVLGGTHGSFADSNDGKCDCYAVKQEVYGVLRWQDGIWTCCQEDCWLPIQ
jgi:hypothetical protein